MVLYNTQITKALIRLRGCAGWSAPVLFANPQRQVFSRRGPIRMMWFFNVLPPSKQLGQSYSTTVKSKLFARILFPGKWCKDIFATFKIHNFDMIHLHQ